MVYAGATEQADGQSEDDPAVLCPLYHPQRTEAARLEAVLLYCILLCDFVYM